VKKIDNDIYAAHQFEGEECIYMKYTAKNYVPSTKEEFDRGTEITKEEALIKLRRLKGL